MELLIGIGIFATIVLFVEGGYFAFTSLKKNDLKKVKKRLRTLSAGPSQPEEVNIVRNRILSQVPWFNRLLWRSSHSLKIHRVVEQANTKYPLGFYLLLSLLMASSGYLMTSLVTPRTLITIPAACFLGTIPMFYIFSRRKKRMQKFERQLPDALDLIARSLKAGHAFSGGLRMVSNEFDDPVGTEFDKTLDEINFGIGIPEALKNLTERVDCPDLKFFVTSVILHRETGGNLAEILENISHIVRERFKLHGRVKTLSAEGKLSAVVLVLIPVVVATVISFVNPDYIRILFSDPIGKAAVVFCIVMMFAGILIMKRIINIRV